MPRMARLASGLLLGGVCIATLGVVGAQTTEQRIPISITNEGGGRKIGLLPEEFVVHHEQDAPRVATQLQADNRPVSAVIIVEGVERGFAAEVRAAVRSLYTNLAEHTVGARVGLMLGTRGAARPELVSLSSASGTLDAAVEGLFESPRTAPVQDLLTSAADALRYETDARRVIFMISINRQAQRSQVPATLVGTLMNADVTLGVVEVNGIGAATSTVTGGTPGRFASNDQTLVLLRQGAGGWYDRIPDVSGLLAATDRMVAALRTASLLSFPSVGTQKGPLRVEVKRLGLTVTAPAWPSR